MTTLHRFLRSSIVVWLAALLVSLAPSAKAQEFGKFCSASGKIVVVLVDRTTAFDAEDRADLIAGLEKIYNRVEYGDRLIVQSITEDMYATPPLFDACRPKCKSLLDDPVQYLNCNPKASNDSDRKFTVNVIEALKQLLAKREEYRTSKLVEFFTQFTEEYSEIGINQLFIYSDLLQNSDVAKPEELFGDTAKLIGQLKAAGLIPSLRGSSVRVFGVGRWHDGARRGLTLKERRQLLSFWEQWFAAGGARETLISQRFRTK